jgi:hypothetical protein
MQDEFEVFSLKMTSSTQSARIKQLQRPSTLQKPNADEYREEIDKFEVDGEGTQTV